MSLFDMLNRDRDLMMANLDSRRRRIVRGVGEYTTPPLASYPNVVDWLDASQGVNAKGAATMNGTTQLFQRTEETTLSGLIGVSYTAGIWYRPSTLDTNGNPEVIYAYRSRTVNACAWQIAQVDASLRFLIKDIDNNEIGLEAVSNVLTEGDWYFIALTRDGTSAIPYINGVAYPGATNAIGVVEVTHLSAGAVFAPTANPGFYNAGTYDNAFISSALTPSELIEIYNSAGGVSYGDLSTTIRNKMFAWYEFDGIPPSGSDSVGSYPLTAINTPSAANGIVEGTADANDPVSSWLPRLGGARFLQDSLSKRPLFKTSANRVYFDGANDGLSRTGAGIVNLTNWGFLAKINPASFDASLERIVYAEQDSGGNGFRIAITPSGSVTATLGGSALSSSVNLSTGSYSTIGAVRRGSTLEVYVNGIQRGTFSLGVIPSYSGVTSYIGESPTTGAVFDGDIEEIYTTGQSPSAADMASLSGDM